MESHYKVLGHPIHPMLVPYPLALLTTATGFDLVGLIGGDGRWHAAAFWMITVGLAVGVLAGLVGALDSLRIPAGTRASSVARQHGLGNATVLVAFALSWLSRLAQPEDPGLLAIGFAVVGSLLLFVTSWLGGELPYRLGIGIDRGAHPDAPSSLSGPATKEAEPADR